MPAPRLAPGNSGGPLADAQGRRIGINPTVVNNGLVPAIPSDMVQTFLRCGARPALRVLRGDRRAEREAA